MYPLFSRGNQNERPPHCTRSDPVQCTLTAPGIVPGPPGTMRGALVLIAPTVNARTTFQKIPEIITNVIKKNIFVQHVITSQIKKLI